MKYLWPLLLLPSLVWATPSWECKELPGNFAVPKKGQVIIKTDVPAAMVIHYQTNQSDKIFNMVVTEQGSQKFGTYIIDYYNGFTGNLIYPLPKNFGSLAIVQVIC